jgi:hypothetical protein
MNSDWCVCAFGESSANFSEKIVSSFFTFILFKEQIRDKCMIKIRELDIIKKKRGCVFETASA